MKIKKHHLGLLALGVLIAVISTFVFNWLHAQAKKTTKTPQSLVTVATAKTALLSHSLQATGNILAMQSTQLSPKTDGYVTAIYYHEGEHVTAGQALVQLDNRHERNAVATAIASFKTSQLQLQRDARLLKRGLIMQDAYHSAEVAAEQNKAALDKAQDDLADKTITAPFSGTIGGRSISVGDYLSAGNTITTLVDRRHLKAVYTLPANYQTQLKLGQEVIVTNEQQRYLAKTSYIAPMVDQATQTIEVHALLNNAVDTLRPGEFINITQVLAKQKPTLIIPALSAQPSLGGYYVYTVRHQRAEKMAVSIGQHYAKSVEITKGLKPGDIIIVGGIEKIHPGSLVKVT